MASFLSTKLPLAMTGVEKHYGDTRVLDCVSIELAPGSITGLLGRNAAGKTTLIRTAVGLLKPTAGEASLFGYCSWECPTEIRQRIGYVAQTFNDMNWLKVETALKLLGSFYLNWDQNLVDRFLDEWKVPSQQKINKLSHGQQQKVAILMAIGHRPDLLILDEPVASLDPTARHDFLRALLMLNDEFNQTILFSSHITTDIERVAADVAILNDGKIIYHGGLGDLKEQVQCVYLRADSTAIDQSNLEGFISSRIDGNRLQVWVRDWNAQKQEELSDQLGANIHVENVGLEELFMGMTS